MGKIQDPVNKSSARIKAPQLGHEPNYDKQKPAFSFYYMKRGDKFCLTKCNDEHKAAVADTMLNLSQMPWEEIKKQRKHGLGFEKIDRDSIKGPIPPEVTPDVNIIAFRYHGKKPMAGFRKNDVFHIVWISPNHDLYK